MELIKPPKNAIIFHVTDRHTFKKCRRVYDLAVNQRIKPKTPNPNFSFGTEMHTQFGHYYGQEMHKERGNFIGDWVRENSILKGESKELLANMLANFHEEYYLTDKNIRIVGIEKTYYWNVFGNVWISAQIDLEFYRGDKKYFRDFKSVGSRFYDKEMYELNDQITLYWKVLKVNGIDVDIAEIVALKKKSSTIPEYNPSTNRFSERKIDITKYDLDNLLQKMNHDPSWYPKLYQRIKETKESPFFKRYPLLRSEKQLGRLIEDQVKSELLDMIDCDSFYPSPSWDCYKSEDDKCEYFNLCHKMQSGLSTKMILENQYVRKGKDER